MLGGLDADARQQVLRHAGSQRVVGIQFGGLRGELRGAGEKAGFGRVTVAWDTVDHGTVAIHLVVADEGGLEHVAEAIASGRLADSAVNRSRPMTFGYLPEASQRSARHATGRSAMVRQGRRMLSILY